MLPRFRFGRKLSLSTVQPQVVFLGPVDNVIEFCGKSMTVLSRYDQIRVVSMFNDGIAFVHGS